MLSLCSLFGFIFRKYYQKENGSKIQEFYQNHASTTDQKQSEIR